MTETRTRTINLDRKAATDNRFPATAATETPVLRSFGYEVLDMTRVDLSRAPLPLIESHDANKVNIGVFEDISVDGDKLRGFIRLGKSARAQELAEDIRAGIVRSVSVGYNLSDPIETGERDGHPVIRFAFQPYELSLVAAPADTNSGIYRSKGNTTMTTETKTRARQESADEQLRLDCIRQASERFDLPTLGMRAIAEGWPVEKFQTEALLATAERNENSRQYHDEGDTTPAPSHNPNHYAGMPCDNSKYGRAMEGYSLLKLMRGLSDPKQLAEAGLEVEISRDMQKVLGRSSRGILVPYEALQSRAIVKSSATSGANLVATDHLSGSFVDVLRARSLVMSLNPTVLRGLVGDVEIPRKTAGSTGYWFNSDNVDDVTESDISMDSITMAPKTVGGAVTFSHRMLVQGSPDVETLVRMDLADMISQEIDRKALNGSGASNQPRGIINTTGINTTTYAVSNAPSFADVVGMETLIAADNADTERMVYLTDPTVFASLKTTPKQGSGVEGNFIMQGNRVNDLRCFRTANMPPGYVILGDWSQLLVGFWGGIELDADPYGANFKKGSVTVRILADVDFNVRQPAAFCEIHNAA
ncbi:phage major capsid protein [Haliea sp. E1-2-M8]|uniref:phage major capsid protein n=1 Tax=Haliea sp. E1-2-M8 TaxID=3064706 RepID=UPI002722FE12|nr:phage major capsid protein [Haliea sp. E1-2-M8]MDO8864043.1 phage major capsid protein [Haliea sp. E1-2-M8]